jgi:hypothetical protein
MCKINLQVHTTPRSVDVKLKVKTILIYFFHCKGIVHLQFVSPDQLSTKGCICKFSNIWDSGFTARPELLPDTWVLHHDNVPLHSTSCEGIFGEKIHRGPARPTTPYLLTRSRSVTSSSSLLWRIISEDHILKPWMWVRRLHQPF